MTIAEQITNGDGGRHFSFEVLPPLKGAGTAQLFNTIDKLVPLEPLFINITTHHSEYVYHEREDGLMERSRVRRRPGTIAIAAAIQNKYHVPVMPHVICSGVTREETEYELIDLQLLGITNLLLLRGDKAQEDKHFKPTPGGHSHTTGLIEQVNAFNAGTFIDGTAMKAMGAPFTYGVACYPEKHEEAPNMEVDISYLKAKQDLGAAFAVTQLFYDNAKYFTFVEQARAAGVTIPIIPAIKPLTKLSQLTIVPKTFHCDIPEPLAREALRCKSDDEAAALGIEWAVAQCEELYDHGVTNIHFYTMSAVNSVAEIAAKLRMKN